MDSRGGEEAPGEESGEGEALVAPEWSRQRRRLELPEMRKTASSGQLAAMGEPEEHSKVSSVLGEAWGPPFIARRGRFRGGRISSPANRLSVACRATWRGWG